MWGSGTSVLVVWKEDVSDASPVIHIINVFVHLSHSNIQNFKSYSRNTWN